MTPWMHAAFRWQRNAIADGLVRVLPLDEPAARAHLRGLAAELGLLTTGSSDFHGRHKTVALGAFTTARDTYEALVAGATGVPVLAA